MATHRQGNTHHDDDRQAGQDAEQHSWKLKRDVWQARAPLAFIESAKDMSELLDSAAWVSILAWTSNAEVTSFGTWLQVSGPMWMGRTFRSVLLYEPLGLLTVGSC